MEACLLASVSDCSPELIGAFVLSLSSGSGDSEEAVVSLVSAGTERGPPDQRKTTSRIGMVISSTAAALARRIRLRLDREITKGLVLPEESSTGFFPQ